MKLNEKYISHLIKNQFPDFYKEEGEIFIDFVRCYYEWLEQNNNELSDTRQFLQLQDIDTTTDEFFNHFQKKYLLGLPEETLIDKPLLIKHIKDVYRSKGTIRGWKLLFRILFNEELDVYLPVTDILTPSEGDWKQPIYLEVTDNGKLNEFIGKKIIGSSTGTTALVESLVYEPINKNIICILYLSNISPIGGNFKRGEKITIFDAANSDVINAPTVIGSLTEVEIKIGGQDFAVGNILRIVSKDPVTNEILTSGVEAELRVTKITKGIGSIKYGIENGGSGYSINPIKVQYKGNTDVTGNGASFSIGSLSDVQIYTFNTDLLIPYLNTALNANSFNFPLNPAANLSSPLISYLQYTTVPYGKISTLTNITTGNSYTQPLIIGLKEGFRSSVLETGLSFTTNTNVVTGSQFTTYLSNNDFIALGNTSNINSFENHIIDTVSNNTHLTLKGPITIANTTTGFYRLYVNPFEANLMLPTELYDEDLSQKGENAEISGIPSIGQGVIATVNATNSGRGYSQNELVKMYLYGAITQPIIGTAGTGYANGEVLIFNGGGTPYKAKGTISTNSNGSITSVNMSSFGSSYQTVPTISVKTIKGSGAVITTQLGNFNTYTIVEGRVKLGGLGKGKGRWISTKSFLNADKYIRDSYFYQSYSYQLKSAINFSRYKEMLEYLFHPSGHEMFGDYTSIVKINSKSNVLYESGAVLS